jgi:hypothetical protein
MAVIATSAEARAAELAAAFSEAFALEAAEGAITLSIKVASAIILSALVQLPGPMFVLKLPVGQAVHCDVSRVIKPMKFGLQRQFVRVVEACPSPVVEWLAQAVQSSLPLAVLYESGAQARHEWSAD